MHYGITYNKLERRRQVQWPCPDVDGKDTKRLHTDLHDASSGRRVPFVPVSYEPPAEPVDINFPFVLITGRRLAFYNTGVTTSDYGPTVKGQEEYLEMNSDDLASLNLQSGDTVHISSKRATLAVPVRPSKKMQPGHVFMSFHFPDQVNTNLLTNDFTDKNSGVAPYKYTAVRIEPIAK
nr:molybdopterin oxidoreductase family protein [Alicyclobacillus sp. SO9]